MGLCLCLYLCLYECISNIGRNLLIRYSWIVFCFSFSKMKEKKEKKIRKKKEKERKKQHQNRKNLWENWHEMKTAVKKNNNSYNRRTNNRSIYAILNLILFITRHTTYYFSFFFSNFIFVIGIVWREKKNRWSEILRKHFQCHNKWCVCVWVCECVSRVYFIRK